MTEVSLAIPRPVSTVFAAIADPWTYPRWLVGCQDIRAVDADWPAPGSRFHHRVGIGPLTIDDATSVLEVREDHLLRLQVRARPLGRGEVTFRVSTAAGATDATFVTLAEVPIGALALARPVLDPLTHARNHRSLAALRSYLAPDAPDGPAAGHP